MLSTVQEKAGYRTRHNLLVRVVSVFTLLVIILLVAPRLYGMSLQSYTVEVMQVDYKQNQAEDGHLYYIVRDTKTKEKYFINATATMNGVSPANSVNRSCISNRLKSGSMVKIRLPQTKQQVQGFSKQFTTCYNTLLNGAYSIQVLKDSGKPFPSGDGLQHWHHETE